MCTEARTSKEDDETDDNFQQSGKARREGWMTEEMPESGTCVGDDWTRGNQLDNQRITFGGERVTRVFRGGPFGRQHSR